MLLKSNFEIGDAVIWKDIHKEETAIIMGNGGSLKTVPKELLEKYPTFGTNNIYLMPFQPTYYVCVDSRVLKDYPNQIYATVAQSQVAFLSDEFASGPEKLYRLENVCLCNQKTVRFPGEFWWTGGTVTYVALKIAFVMGFGTILLVGCDWDDKWKHFSDEYPSAFAPKDYRKKQEYHLGIAGHVYQDAGRRIVNLSPPSVLDEYYERGSIDDHT